VLVGDVGLGEQHVEEHRAARVAAADRSLDELAAVCYDPMYDVFCEIQRRRCTGRGGSGCPAAGIG